MADKSAIEWTDASWTPIRARETRTGKIGWHCEHASEGCRFCYAEGINRRLGTGVDFKPGHLIQPFSQLDGVEVFLDEKMLLAPLKWKKPRMIFVCSMTDLFAGFVEDEWIDRVFAIMALAPQHTFQVLTKRAARMRAYIMSRSRPGPKDDEAPAVDIRIRMTAHHARPGKWAQRIAWPLPNVWLGVSAERQKEADERIPPLLATPAAVRFVSLEPLLGSIDLNNLPSVSGIGRFLDALMAVPYSDAPHALDWIIVGGESGKEARAMEPAWARSLRDQCAAADVAFFFKQWGEHGRVGDQPGLDHLPEDADCLTRMGQKAAGRILDGREHNDFPKGASS